jgi:hypothetical protein
MKFSENIYKLLISASFAIAALCAEMPVISAMTTGRALMTSNSMKEAYDILYPNNHLGVPDISKVPIRQSTLNSLPS